MCKLKMPHHSAGCGMADCVSGLSPSLSLSPILFFFVCVWVCLRVWRAEVNSRHLPQLPPQGSVCLALHTGTVGVHRCMHRWT